QKFRERGDAQEILYCFHFCGRRRNDSRPRSNRQHYCRRPEPERSAGSSMPPARLSTANPPQRLAREQPSVWCRRPDQGLHPLSPAASSACAQHVDFKRIDHASFLTNSRLTSSTASIWRSMKLMVIFVDALEIPSLTFPRTFMPGPP